MRLVRNLLLVCLAVTPLVFAPAAQADQWRQSDGYWYFWSDSNQRWYYLDGKKWQVFQNGQWVDSGAPSLQTNSPVSSPGYSSYFYDPSPSSSGRNWSYSGGGHR
jgi:hypothetical protein